MNAKPPKNPSTPRRTAVCAALAGAVIAVAGCATRSVDSQWVDPQLSGQPLRDRPVYVVCEAASSAVGQICAERLAAELRARGATVVMAPAPTAVTPGQAGDDTRYLAPARAAGAGTVWAARIGQDLSDAYRGGSGVTLGIGGISIGRGGGVGVGISAPLGGGGPGLQHVADARVTDAASGRLLWAARAGAPATAPVEAELDGLLQRLVGTAGEAGLY